MTPYMGHLEMTFAGARAREMGSAFAPVQSQAHLLELVI